MDANTGSKIADDLANAFTFKGARKAASDAMDKVKNVISGKPVNPPQDTSWHDQKVREANASHAAAVAPKAAPAKPAGKMPSYKEGTLNVPKTGPAKLHKGEAVLPKEHAQHLRDAVSGALGGQESKPKKEIKHIVTKKAHNGGYIHEHHHTHPEHHPMEEHVSPDQDAMVEHMMEHMGTPNDGEQEADAGQMPGGAAPQGPQMGA